MLTKSHPLNEANVYLFAEYMFEYYLVKHTTLHIWGHTESNDLDFHFISFLFFI